MILLMLDRLHACREIRRLHMDTCSELNIEKNVQGEILKLLDQLQQLLIGICLIQVRSLASCFPHFIVRTFHCFGC